ncbi:MAG: hypothetical protein L6408_06675 [Nanoarchaeota archaeon]|nr:hypothetical protein [Nanoarchaeota archaeon]
MKKKTFILGSILACLILFCVYFVFGEPLDVTPISVIHSFAPDDGFGVSNYTKGGLNATINFTLTMVHWDEDVGNITEINFAMPDNVIFSDVGNVSNGTDMNTSLGNDWWCESNVAVMDYHLNWSCYNGSHSQLGSNDEISIWFNFTANETGTEEIIIWAITIVGNGSDQDANITNYYTNLDDLEPRVILDNPDDEAFLEGSMVFNYTATDLNLDTCELWGNWSDGWHMNESFTSLISGKTNGSSAINIEDGLYVWSVYCNDTLNHWNTSVANRTLTVESTQNFIVASDTSQFNITVGSNSKYTLVVNITNHFGGQVNNTIITWYLPYGIVNNSVCNGTNGFWRVNSTVYACDQDVGNISKSLSTSANETFTLEVNDTIEAFSDYYTFSGVAVPETFWITVNCTTDDNSVSCTQNDTVLNNSYGVNYWKNPRPYAVNDTSTENITLRFENWAQARDRYEVWVPMMTYNQSRGRPEPSQNNSWADLVYADKSFLENPTYFELWGYRLNFTFYNDSAASDNITFHIYTPKYEYENQTLQPLLIRNETKTNRDGTNSSQIIAAPAQSGFTVWYNGTELTSTTLTNNFGINITYHNAYGRQNNKLLTVVSVPQYENVSLSIVFSLMSNSTSPSSRSPIHVLMQDVGGFNPEDAPPVLNGSIDMNFRIDIENALQNFTLDGLSVHLLNPINLTNEATGESVNMSENAVVSWLYPGNDTWMDNENIVTKEVTFSMDDNVSGSPNFGNNMSIYFKTYDIDLNHSYFNNWDPGSSASNISVNLTATVKFPIANFTDSTPDTAGSFNEYNMSMSMSQRGALNMTEILSGVGTDVNTTISVYLDGTLLTNGANYTVGSLEVNDVGQGSHTVTVSYTKASAAAAPTAGGTTSTAQGGYAAIDASEGIVRTMSIKDALVISLGESGGGSAGGTAAHQIVLDKLTSDSVNLLIYSEPIEVTLKVGESKKVDVDDDGILDVLIKLRSIDVPHKKADIYFEDITPAKEVAPPGGIKEVGEEIVEEKPEVPTGKAPAVPEEVPESKVWLWALITVVIIVIGVGYWFIKKKYPNIFSKEPLQK